MTAPPHSILGRDILYRQHFLSSTNKESTGRQFISVKGNDAVKRTKGLTTDCQRKRRNTNNNEKTEAKDNKKKAGIK